MKGSSVAASDRYARQRQCFDVAAKKRKNVAPISKATIDRYAHTRHPDLFPKEYLFYSLGNLAGKRVLELGCGVGLASVQMAIAGAEVTGLDISRESVAAAR